MLWPKVSGERSTALHPHPVVYLQRNVQGFSSRVAQNEIGGKSGFFGEARHHHWVRLTDHQARAAVGNLARRSGTHIMPPKGNVGGVALGAVFDAACTFNATCLTCVLDTNT